MKKTAPPKKSSKPSKPAPPKAYAKPARPTAPARKAVPTKPPAKPNPVAKPAARILPKQAAAPVVKGKTALPAAKTTPAKPKNTNGHSVPKPMFPVPKPTQAPVFKSTPKPDPVIAPGKDISTRTKVGPIKDRIVLMVPDPFWLHAVWELSQQSVFRAESALGQDWFGAKPIIRLFDVTSTDTTSTSETPIRDIPVHGGCSHWYVDVPQPPRSYRVDVGYLSKRGQFFVLARSNVVTPPMAGAAETVEENWVADIEKAGGPDRVLAMSTGFETQNGPSQLKEYFDDQFKKPAKDGSFGTGAVPSKLKKFYFDLDAELIVFGRAEPSATVTMQNERVPLRPDGTFTMRFSLPDSRQIIPAVAASADGLEEQTIVLAVERNIKRLDPTTHDMYGEN